MDFAASSVRRNASTLPMSGFAAPARTTIPTRDRASSTLLSARTNPPSRARRRPRHPGSRRPRFAARETGGNRLRRVAHRGPARRDQTVAAGALERRAQLSVSPIETRRYHHAHVVGRGRARQPTGRPRQVRPTSERARAPSHGPSYFLLRLGDLWQAGICIFPEIQESLVLGSCGGAVP